MMEDLILKLKKEIIDILNLEDLTPEDLEAEDSLFGEGLGLDSIDALELMVLLEKNYGLKIEDPKQGRKVLYSIKTMAEYILENQKN
jgi:acyl carrier protein